MPGTIYTSAPSTPAVVGFSKLEVRAVDVDLVSSFEVNVHDALWMLTQQWRMGEFKAFDGGTAVQAKILSKSSLLNRYQTPSMTQPIEYKHDRPLESLVEKLPPIIDLSSRLQSGRYLVKLIKRTPGTESLVASMISNFPVDAAVFSDEDNFGDSNSNLNNLLLVAANKCLDGVTFYAAVKDHLTNPFDTGEPLEFVTGGDQTIISDVLGVFIPWYQSKYEVLGDETSWDAKSLSYKFKTSAPETTDTNSEQILLNGDNYKSGYLDWYELDFNKTPGELQEEPPAEISNSEFSGTDIPVVETKIMSYVPTNISFRGMPVNRWWEFEEAMLDIGRVSANKQEMLKRMIVDFGLAYSNDWFLFPMKVKAGSITALNALLVKDVFGFTTKIEAAGHGDDNDWQRWAMYNLNITGDESVAGDVRLFFAPSVEQAQESEPIERVVFLRDEMSNMVWGIEEYIPDMVSSGRQGHLAELELLNYLQENDLTNPSEYNPVPTGASISFQLRNALPEYWIPFIPVKDETTNDGRSTRFRRGRFNRILGNTSSEDFVKPRTNLLKSGSPFFINEEEILKPGVVVEGRYQRARWYNGKTATWYGYSRTAGRGEGRSGLKFDSVINL